MHYLGGKERVAKYIVEIINTFSFNTLISPFVGGASVESRIIGNKILSDNHFYLIELYKALQNGFVPPDTLTEQEYYYIKQHKDENPALTGFVGFGCSFSGKWFGGYARSSEKRNYCLNAKNSILTKMRGLQNAKFYCSDYRDINIPNNSLIYCDPPYINTTKYTTGDFDSEEFWDIIRDWSKYTFVLVSEYSAPKDFKSIWNKEYKRNMRGNNLNIVTDNLFIYRGCYEH